MPTRDSSISGATFCRTGSIDSSSFGLAARYLNRLGFWLCDGLELRTGLLRGDAGDSGPRCERVFDAAQGGPQVGEVAQQDGCETVVGDPGHSCRRVNLRREVGGEEPVAVEPARGHQDEDPEGGITEAKARWGRLGIEADHQVDLVNVALIDPPDLLRPGRIRA